jgi:kinesin family protein 5
MQSNTANNQYLDKENVDSNIMVMSTKATKATTTAAAAAVASDPEPGSLLHRLQERPELIFDVLKFLNFQERSTFTGVSKLYSQLLNNSFYWKFLCNRLAEEARLYVADDMCDAGPLPAGVWRELFIDLWDRRTMWDAIAPATAEDDAAAMQGKKHRFSIGVSVRFRPSVSGAGGEDGPGEHVVLPLHQRIKLVQGAHGNCSRAEAMRHLMSERYGKQADSQDPWAGATCTGAKEEKKEEEGEGKEGEDEENKGLFRTKQVGGNMTASILGVEEEQRKVLTVAPGCGLREFNFDTVFGQKTQQTQVYSSMRRLVADVVNGFNATILVYGQTGSGKTFTMFGGDAVEANEQGTVPTSGGIVPRAVGEILNAVAAREKDSGIVSRLAVSYIEIFGDQVGDLLNGGEQITQNRAAAQRFVLEGSAEREIKSISEVHGLLVEGDSQKRKAATAMNEKSSRAHTLFILSLEQTDPALGVTHRSKLFLADLGGCEQLKRSKADEGIVKMAGRKDAKKEGEEGYVEGEEGEEAEGANWAEYYRQRQRLQEAQNINLGLFALKACIDALNRQQEDKKKHVFVPYSNSKLTLLLSDGLGGNSKTAVVVCGSTERQNAVETLQALRFGEACSRVENEAVESAAALARALERLAVQIKACEAAIQEKEKWVERKLVRKDDDGEGNVREEVITTTVLAGAEAERDQLQALMKKQAELLGEELEDDSWASRITQDVNNVMADGKQYNINAFEETTMQM